MPEVQRRAEGGSMAIFVTHNKLSGGLWVKKTAIAHHVIMLTVPQPPEGSLGLAFHETKDSHFNVGMEYRIKMFWLNPSPENKHYSGGNQGNFQTLLCSLPKARFALASLLSINEKHSTDFRGRTLGIMTAISTTQAMPPSHCYSHKEMKKQLVDNESITQDVVGNAHVENYAYKMFLYADTEDRAERFHNPLKRCPLMLEQMAVMGQNGRFSKLKDTELMSTISKNMIKSFYTASLLYDVLTVFGELTDENIQHRKYAKWKAAYIHNCLKNGETPKSGPIAMENEFENENDVSLPSSSTVNNPGAAMPSSEHSSIQNPTADHAPSNFSTIHIPPGAHAPANTPAEVPGSSVLPNTPTIQPGSQNVPIIDPSLYSTKPQGDIRLTPEDYARAQKYCKYAGSALQYEDVGTAVQNLQKALKLLTTGRE
ncbi:vacuolar protein sorting-associated protein VTA1 homolog [Narcine bancroftii]|uniref:vacuolar protein sorting-associated protein VTA1 homolog n=1 Tax=Narcine bancroftii TaxID=1343680 RepID=UPI003831039E